MVLSACKLNGYEYFEYMLVYVDDVLTLLHDGKHIKKSLKNFYRLKDE
jgi:hypothetical protein